MRGEKCMYTDGRRELAWKSRFDIYINSPKSNWFDSSGVAVMNVIFHFLVQQRLTAFGSWRIIVEFNR